MAQMQQGQTFPPGPGGGVPPSGPGLFPPGPGQQQQQMPPGPGGVINQNGQHLPSGPAFPPGPGQQQQQQMPPGPGGVINQNGQHPPSGGLPSGPGFPPGPGQQQQQMPPSSGGVITQNGQPQMLPPMGQPNHVQPGMPPQGNPLEKFQNLSLGDNAGVRNGPGNQYPAYPQPQQPPISQAPNGHPMPGPGAAGQQTGFNPQFQPGPNAYTTGQQPQYQRPPGPGQPGPGIPPGQPSYPSYGQPGQQVPGMGGAPAYPQGVQQPLQKRLGPDQMSSVPPIQPGQPSQIQPGMPPMPVGNQPPNRYPAYPQQPPLPHAPNGPGMPGQQPGYNQQFQPGPQMNAYPPGPQQFQRPPGPGQPGPGVPPGQPGYPSYGQPGQPGQPAPGMGGTPAYPQPTQQSQKRLDPDQMPSAIAVMQEDQQGRSGVFVTNQKGLLPPLVTTKFQVDDQGNTSPRYIRSTMYSVPALPDMLKQTAIPFALIVNPFESPAKDEPPIACVDLGSIGPVRCIRCKAYMSPLMQFIDGGRRFQCLLCKATTEVPPEYFQHLDHTGQRLDKWERPELLRGTYEFVATAEYCRNNVLPKEPAFIFVIDVSYNNVKSGLVNLLCSHIKSLVEVLPPQTPVGFVTYSSKVHFYNIEPSLAQPQMVIVPDVADMFMPLLTGFLVPRAEAAGSIEALMEQIPAMFADTKETEAVLGPAIVAGMEALKASDRAGKLLLFHSSLPTSDVAPGKLKNREADRKLLGTDKEKVVLTPQTTYYNTLGQDCVAVGVSVDLYLFNNSYIDVATIGQVARITGGSVNKYTYFQADIDGPRIIGEIHYHLSRPIGFDGVLRVRTSTGVRPVDFYGHYYMSNTTDVELAAIDSQKSIAVEIKHDDKLTDEDGVYIQIALLYTSLYGQRRLRIHNIALSTCMQMADLYRNCELDTIINFLAKQGISKSIDSTPQALKDGVISRCAQMLATYRKHCANPSMPGQLILPECLKLLPLYTNCVLRSDAVAGTSELTPDDRSWLMYTVMTMGVSNTVHYFYPKLIPIAGPGVSLDNPSPMRCSRDKMSDEFAFILENGIYIFMWIGVATSPDWLQNIFGVSNLAQINVETITELPDHVNSDESLRLRALIRSLRTERQRHMRLTIVRQRDKMEMVMNKFLVEDRGAEGQPSYVDFLCHMHKEIRALLNQ